MDFDKTSTQDRWKWQTTSAQWSGCFCRKMCRSNTCRKSHFVRKIHPALCILSALRIQRIYRIMVWSERENSPEGARRLQTGVLAPGDGYPHTGKPWMGERSFVPSALILLGSGITGAYTPACGLVSLSGLGLVKQKIWLICWICREKGFVF